MGIMEMDRTVIILIGAGVCCAVIGLALFIKLLTTKTDYNEDDVGKKKLLDDEYMDNFEECFANTGNIEDTLDQLAHVYTGNQFMYNLIVSAIDYLNDGEGDYETALEKINVDSDINVMKMHNTAIRKALNIETKPAAKKQNDDVTENKSLESNASIDSMAQSNTAIDETEYFDEDDESEIQDSDFSTSNESDTESAHLNSTDKISQNQGLASCSPIDTADEDFDDDDLDDFKI